MRGKSHAINVERMELKELRNGQYNHFQRLNALGVIPWQTRNINLNEAKHDTKAIRRSANEHYI